MNLDFKNCLRKNKIREFTPGKSLIGKEIGTAREDIKEAKESLARKKYKWATIQAYYSMFHSARALLYNKNYREKSHYCLIIAIRTFYVETGKLSPNLLEGLQRGKNLREDADYYNEWSKAGAEEMINISVDFLDVAQKILNQ